LNKAYQESLINNPYWENVKQIIKTRDKKKCAICGNITQLQVHHITYKINGKSIVNSELNYLKWLITLCKKCHEDVHEDKSHSLNPRSYLKINAFDWYALKGIKL